MNKNLKLSIMFTITLLLGITCFTYLDSYPISAESSKIEDLSFYGKHANGHEIVLAFDGNLDTYWESPGPNSMEDHRRFIEVDLNGLYELEKIEIANKEGSYYHYQIYTSQDGNHYDKVAYKSDNKLAKGFDTYQINEKARFVRVNVSYNSAKQAVNIAELNFYGELIDDSDYAIPEIKVKDFKDTEYSKEHDRFHSDLEYRNKRIKEELSDLVSRVLGKSYVDNFIFEITDDLENDFFELSDSADKILIRGNNGGTLASGFNHYLKKYAKLNYNPLFGSNIQVNKPLPPVNEEIIKQTPYDYRYALNFVTHSYTMPFWKWEEHQEFLDWAAMNGANLVLDLLGQEEVLRQTLKEYGYSDQEVKEYLTGPAYFGWFYMQNMYSFGGPLPDDWFEQRTDLARKVHERMMIYDISPVMQGFAGQVPLDFAEKNPDSITVNPGTWPGFQRPYLIKTYLTEADKEQGKEDYFERVSQSFYKNQERLFGDITKYFAVDPFHEGGDIAGTGMNIEDVYAAVQEQMIHAKQDSIWVMQQWQWNVTDNKLDGLPNKDQALVLDLQSDLNSQTGPMEKHGVKWIWNMLHNFGGRMGLDGEPETLATKITEDFYRSDNMVGIGITPEAINNSPIVYDLMGDMVWETDPINYHKWTYDYIESRYGVKSENLEKAWDILLNTAYSQKGKYYQGASESVINAKPALKINSASTWGHSDIMYDKEEMEKAVAFFIEEYDHLQDNPAFIYDFVDVVKQLLNNSAQEYHLFMARAYRNKNYEEFTYYSEKFLDLIKLQEKVLSTSEQFLLGDWIGQSRTMLEDMDDWTRDLFEFNARALITTWGAQKNAVSGGLDDYSNRHWSGLTEDYYLPRWETWIKDYGKALKDDTTPAQHNWFMSGWEWVNKKSNQDHFYPTEASNENLKKLAIEAVKNFSVKNIEKDSQLEEINNLALGKVPTANVDTAEGYDIKSLTDGDIEKGWKPVKSTTEMTIEIDLGKIFTIDEIIFSLQQIAKEFPVNYSIDIYDGSEWHNSIHQDLSGNITSTNKISYEGLASKVRFNFKSATVEDLPEIKEIEINGKKLNASGYTNIAKEASVTSSSQQPGQGAENIVDENDETLWVARNGETPAWAQLELSKAESIDKINVKFEQNTPDRSFAFEVLVTNENGEEEKVFERSRDQLNVNHDEIYTIDINDKIKKVRIKINEGRVPSTGGKAWALISEVELLQKANQAIETINIAPNGTVSSSVPAENGHKPENIIDEDYSTLWIADRGQIPASLTLDLVKESYVEDINLVFERAHLKFKFIVTANKGTEDEFILLDMNKQHSGLEKIQNIDVNKLIQSVTIEYLGTTDPNDASWPALAQLEVFTKPENIAPDAIISSNIPNVENLNDLNLETGIKISNSDDKIVNFEFEELKDIHAIELITDSTQNSPLRYTIIGINEAGEEVTLVDNFGSSDQGEKVANKFNPQNIKKLKFVFKNEELVLKQIRIFEADYSYLLVQKVDEINTILSGVTIGEYAGNYNETSKEVLLKELTQAKELVKTNPNSVEVRKSLEKLDRSLNNFYLNGFVSINRDELLKAIVHSKRLIERMKKEDLHLVAREIEKAVVEAESIYHAYKVKQIEIDEATQRLKDQTQEILNQIEDFEKEANKIKRLIYNLPKVSAITLDDQAVVNTVRAAYETLSEAAKIHVTTLGNLELRENRLAALSSENEAVADQFAVRELQRRIYRLPSARIITLKEATQVERIRADYEALNEASKEIFSPQYLKNLELREVKIEELERN